MYSINCSKCLKTSMVDDDKKKYINNCDCGFIESFHLTPCCEKMIKVCDGSLDDFAFSIEFKCCDDEYLFLCNDETYEVIKINNVNHYSNYKFMQIMYLRMENLENNFNELSNKLTRLLDMVEFSPDGGPGAIEAKKLFNEHANTN